MKHVLNCVLFLKRVCDLCALWLSSVVVILPFISYSVRIRFELS
jgi:hypothetical protein